MKKILSLALSLVMILAFAVPAMAIEYPDVKGDSPVAAKKGQTPVLKDGVVWDTLGTVYTGNSSANHGYKISANKSYNEIKLDGNVVGYFTFDKKGNDVKPNADNLVIVITEDVKVTVRWDCSKYYAYAVLDGAGRYSLPQLMQDNGKIQSFDQIWIVNVEPNRVELYGDISLKKTVENQWITEWCVDSGIDIADIINDMFFDFYMIEDKGEKLLGEPIGSVKLGADGMIELAGLPAGWYAIVERFTPESLASKLFVDEKRFDVYVTEAGVNSDGRSIVSDESYGVLVLHDGTGVAHALPNVWNDQLVGQPAFDKLMAMGAQWIWDTKDTYKYGVTGSVFETDFTVEIDEAVTVPFYFAADNAAVIYVNGVIAGYTTVALKNSLSIGDAYDPDVFGFLDHDSFDGRWTEGWTHAYKIDIDLVAGENEIQVVAANSIRTENTGTANDQYDTTNNPCGVIFGFEIPGVVFDNELNPPVETFGEWEVVPMVSNAIQGAVEVTTSWGVPYWTNALQVDFAAAGAVDTTDDVFNRFVNGNLTDVYAGFIWDKSEDEVTTEVNQTGEDIAHFRFEYNFEDGVDPSKVLFTDFKIAADNEFAILVNGKLLRISENFKNIVGIDESYVGDISAIFNKEYLASFSTQFWALNDPDNNLEGVYSWTWIYDIPAAEMLAAFDGSDSVVIEIYAYNVPENSWPHQSVGVNGNPAMVIFAGSFAYYYKQ